MVDQDYIWCIAYISRDQIHRVEKDIAFYKFDIEAYIPTVKILKKKFKGKEEFEFIPLLFNYGFFKLPYKDACNHDYLSELRVKITCIYSWVRDPAALLDDKELPLEKNQLGDIKMADLNDKEITKLLKESNSHTTGWPKTAIASDKEIATLIKQSGKKSIFSKDDINNLKPDMVITLHGYPFDNVRALVIDLNKSSKVITVELLLGNTFKEVKVSFENVFYTIYKDFDENKSVANKLLEDIANMSKTSLDKLYAKVQL